jgi:hypothetical protein
MKLFALPVKLRLKIYSHLVVRLQLSGKIRSALNYLMSLGSRKIEGKGVTIYIGNTIMSK